MPVSIFHLVFHHYVITFPEFSGLCISHTAQENKGRIDLCLVHFSEPVACANTSIAVWACLCVNMCQCSILFCLFLPVLPKPQVSYKTTSPGVIEANCTSVSRPPAEIVWNVERDNRTMGPPVTTQLPQGDGTTLVISTLTVRSGLLKDVSVKCLVHHKGLESPIAVSMNTKSELVSVNLCFNEILHLNIFDSIVSSFFLAYSKVMYYILLNLCHMMNMFLYDINFFPFP